jgi:hypothetical protein
MRRGLLLGLLVATACSNGHASSNAAADLQRAMQRTRAAGSARVAVVMSNGLQEDSVEDFATHNAEGTASTLNESVQIRLVDGVEYLKVPKSERAALGRPTTPWVSVGGPGQPAGAAPIDALLYGATNVKRTNGTHFAGTINLLQVVDHIPPAAREELARHVDLEKGVQSLARIVGFEPSFVASLDQQGRVVGFALSSTVGGKVSSITYGVNDFGVKTHIVAPPPDEVSPSKSGLGPTV